MTNEDFESSVMEALAKASASLRAADIEALWLDTSGSGWTQTYDVMIRTKTPHRREVRLPDMEKYLQGNKEARADGATAWVDDLPPEAEQAVSDALSRIDLGEQVMWGFSAVHERPSGALVWPISRRIKALRRKITDIEEEIDRLLALEKFS